MALSFKSVWKYLSIVSGKRKTVLTTDYQRKREPSHLRKWLKCLFYGHDPSSELRVKKRDAHYHYTKRHYRYCKCCGKRWYED